MPGEFPPIVGGNSEYLPAIRLEQVCHGLTYRFGSFAFYLTHQSESCLALDECDNSLPVILADHGVGLPVTDPVACFHNGRALFNRLPIGNDAATIRLTVPFPALLLAAELFP